MHTDVEMIHTYPSHCSICVWHSHAAHLASVIIVLILLSLKGDQAQSTIQLSLKGDQAQSTIQLSRKGDQAQSTIQLSRKGDRAQSTIQLTRLRSIVRTGAATIGTSVTYTRLALIGWTCRNNSEGCCV